MDILMLKDELEFLNERINSLEQYMSSYNHMDNQVLVLQLKYMKCYKQMLVYRIRKMEEN